MPQDHLDLVLVGYDWAASAAERAATPCLRSRLIRRSISSSMRSRGSSASAVDSSDVASLEARGSKGVGSRFML